MTDPSPGCRSSKVARRGAVVDHQPVHQHGIYRHQAAGTVKSFLSCHVRVAGSEHVDQASIRYGIGAPLRGQKERLVVLLQLVQ